MGSDVDSSSGPEEDADQITHLTKCDHLTIPASADPRTPPGISPIESGSISTPPHSPGGASTVSGNHPNRVSRPAVFFRDASNVWTHEPVGGMQAPRSPGNWSHESDDMRVPADRSRSNATDLNPAPAGVLKKSATRRSPLETNNADLGFDNLLSAGLKPADRAEILAEKYSYLHPVRLSVLRTSIWLPQFSLNSDAFRYFGCCGQT